MHSALPRKLRTDVKIVLGVVLLPIMLLLLVPAPRHHYDQDMIQRGQLNTLYTAVHLFLNEFDGYPPSDADDVTGVSYCGAMKLAEALVGKDLQGFHSMSVYRADGTDRDGRVLLYPQEPNNSNLTARRGPYVPMESARVFRLADVYGKGNTGPFAEDTIVLCDTYERQRPSGRKTGMPILYYRANPAEIAGDVDKLYDYVDNQALINLGVPGAPKKTHPLADPECFCRNVQRAWSARKLERRQRDCLILISAGKDGLYGTADDIHHFGLEPRSDSSH